MNFIKSIYLILFSILASCQGNKKENSSLILKDSSFHKILNDEKIFKSRRYLLKNEVSKMLNLDYLEDGFDSFQIRVWKGYVVDSINIFIFKMKGESLFGEKIRTTVNKDNNLNLVTTVKTRDTLDEKLVRWVFENFDKLKLGELEDDSFINDYPSFIPDVMAVYFEFARDNIYRYYDYAAPCYARNEVWQARNLCQFIEMID